MAASGALPSVLYAEDGADVVVSSSSVAISVTGYVVSGPAVDASGALP